VSPLSSEWPLISVVVPSFNQAAFLRETLSSLLDQRYPHLEILVMDGGSTDGSVEIIHEFEPHLAFWRSEADDGQSAAINEGVERANGVLVGWLNSDDYLLPRALWTVARAYRQHPGRGLYIGNGLRYDQKPNRFRAFCSRHLALNREALRSGVDYVLQPATFFLRSAWVEAGGLNRDLHFCMDWDMYLRMAEKHPAVMINDFLAVSREYEDTKTGAGGLERVVEISGMVERYTGKSITPGVMHYMLESLLDHTAGKSSEALQHHLYKSLLALSEDFGVLCGNADGFPAEGDSQDSVYNPNASETAPSEAWPVSGKLPTISIVTPSFNQGQFIEATLKSLLDQQYSALETIVYDAGSTDGTHDVLKQYEDRLTFWTSEPDRGPADAINKGFKRATGEIVGWLNSDDMLAADALQEVGRAFAADPELDMVFANALYIDEANNPCPMDHGGYKTALYFGHMQAPEDVRYYWKYVHSLPQPTVFFRRSLLERYGYLNEEYHFIFDLELFWRLSGHAKVKKLERTMAFYRIHSDAKTSDWQKFLVELYRFSRPQWPRWTTQEFRRVWGEFLIYYIRGAVGDRSRDFWFWLATLVTGVAVWFRIGNPERVALKLPPVRGASAYPQSADALTNLPKPPLVELADPEYAINKSNVKYTSLFCSFTWPKHPGHSGGEIRDFHLIRHLLSISRLHFIQSALYPEDSRSDLLCEHMEGIHTRTRSAGEVAAPGFWRRLDMALRGTKRPVPWGGHHLDVLHKWDETTGFVAPTVQRLTAEQSPDFVFVSPQSNPAPLLLSGLAEHTRVIMASYDVEAERIERLGDLETGLKRVAMRLEARRAARFERKNLQGCDGVIAVSDEDRDRFIADYGLAPDRVLTIENGVDPEYFQFRKRVTGERPEVVYVASFTYPPNVAAAYRLIEGIMPLVRAKIPTARLWLVGQGADAAMLARNDADTVITGSVDDVRPYLASANVACIPLSAGSGSKYKVLEAASAGVPLVCTDRALQGIDLTPDEHVLVGENNQALADAIVTFLENADEAQQMAQRAREKVVATHAWDANLKKLDDWLATLARMPVARKEMRV
jgi:glycosyltransferase involved in cell wall biosynthesis